MTREFTGRERVGLIALAIASGLGLNGVFIYGALRPDVVIEALGNPVAIAFVAEAIVLVALLAYMLERWQLSRLRWPWLVGLSLLGGLAFALPIALLWESRRGDTRGYVTTTR